MEEDIKILENLKDRKLYFTSSMFQTGWVKLGETEKQAIENLIARYKELEEDIGKEYHLGFAQGSYEKDEDWKFKLREKITEIDKQGDTPHVRDMSYKTKKGFVIYKEHAIRIIEDILED